ncbi:MAG: GNAT family N-acetyltransferase [Gaiellales bacterium]
MRKPETLGYDPTPTATVRSMHSEDVSAVVAVHLRAFPGFFLSFLGPRFLSVLYRAAVELDEITLVAVSDGKVAGLVMGSAEPGEFFGKLRRARALQFAYAALPSVLRRPGATLRVARALRKPKEAGKAAGTATLLSIAVDPALQTRGLGRLLVRAFVQRAAARGAVRVDLTTDKCDNDPVNTFYRGMGFRVAREIQTPEGRVLNEYELDVPAVQTAY